MEQIYKKYVTNPSKNGELSGNTAKDPEASRSLSNQMMGANSIPATQQDSDIDSVFHSYSHNKDLNANGERDVDVSNG